MQTAPARVVERTARQSFRRDLSTLEIGNDLPELPVAAAPGLQERSSPLVLRSALGRSRQVLVVLFEPRAKTSRRRPNN